MYQGKVDLHLHLDGSLSEPFMRDRLREQFAFTDADFLRMDENALWGAFLPETKKAALVQRLRAGEECHTVSG